MSNSNSCNRVRAALLASVTCCVGFALTSAASAAPASQPSDAASKVTRAAPGTIGFVVTDWRYGFYLTSTPEEQCTLGLQPGEPAQARAQKGYAEVLQTYGGSYENRGPNGEMANFNPLAVDDPLPFSELKSKIGYGLNLDGTQDGSATAKTCKHEKFTSADGEKVDNQAARALGCFKSFRVPDDAESFASTELINSNVNRRLVEITGVDDEQNDPSVEVTMYKGRDVITRTPAGDKFLPYQSHRIDERFPQFNNIKTKGKIVDGVLITEPVDGLFPKGNPTRQVGEYDLKDMVMRIKLNAEGAEGFVAGYEHIDKWYSPHMKGVTSGLSQYNNASLYKALLRYADGGLDPKTGKCDRISITYRVKAVRALVVHKPKTPQRVAQN